VSIYIYIHMYIGGDLISIETRKRCSQRFIYFNNNIIITNGPEAMCLRGVRKTIRRGGDDEGFS